MIEKFQSNVFRNNLLFKSDCSEVCLQNFLGSTEYLIIYMKRSKHMVQINDVSVAQNIFGTYFKDISKIKDLNTFVVV